MTDKIEDGGPAFPTDPNTQPGFYQHHGMSLRDWFAGQALAGWLASFGESARYPVEKGSQGITTANAYAMADAMLAARKVRS